MQCIRSIKQADRELVRSPRCRYQAPDQDSGSWFGYGIGTHQINLVSNHGPDSVAASGRTCSWLVAYTWGRSVRCSEDGLASEHCWTTTGSQESKRPTLGQCGRCSWQWEAAWPGSGVLFAPHGFGHLEVLCLSGQLSSPRCQPRGSEP